MKKNCSILLIAAVLSAHEFIIKSSQELPVEHDGISVLKDDIENLKLKLELFQKDIDKVQNSMNLLTAQLTKSAHDASEVSQEEKTSEFSDEVSPLESKSKGRLSWGKRQTSKQKKIVEKDKIVEEKTDSICDADDAQGDN